MDTTVIQYGLYKKPKIKKKAKANLSLNFVFPLEFMKNWERCSLASDFLAEYESFSFKKNKKAVNLVSTIINELMENAIKFSSDQNKLVTVNITHYDHAILLEATNMTEKENVQKLQRFVKDLESKSPDELFFELLSNLENTDTSMSGLGLITIVKDFNASLGIMAAPLTEGDSIFRISIRVYIDMTIIDD